MRNWRASFDDPVTGERLPVYLSAGDTALAHAVDTNLAIAGGIAGSGARLATMDAYQDIDAPNEWEVAFAHTEDELRRRGIATALYDLVASIIENEYGGSLYGSGSLSEAFQSEYARALWESNHQGGRDSWSPSRSLWRDRRDAE